MAFFLYRRIYTRKGDMDINLVEEDTEKKSGMVSFRKTGIFFSKRSEQPSSSSEHAGVSNPSYDIAHADDVQ